MKATDFIKNTFKAYPINTSDMRKLNYLINTKEHSGTLKEHTFFQLRISSACSSYSLTQTSFINLLVKCKISPKLRQMGFSRKNMCISFRRSNFFTKNFDSLITFQIGVLKHFYIFHILLSPRKKSITTTRERQPHNLSQNQICCYYKPPKSERPHRIKNLKNGATVTGSHEQNSPLRGSVLFLL